MASKPGLATSQFSDTLNETAQNVSEKASDLATNAKQKIAETGRQVTETVDQKRGPAADALHGAASTIHEKADSLPGGETVRSVAHSAADKLESTAGYIREHDVKGMVADLEEIVRRNPGPSLLIATAIGFLLGRAFRED